MTQQLTEVTEKMGKREKWRKGEQEKRDKCASDDTFHTDLKLTFNI